MEATQKGSGTIAMRSLKIEIITTDDTYTTSLLTAHKITLYMQPKYNFVILSIDTVDPHRTISDHGAWRGGITKLVNQVAFDVCVSTITQRSTL